jgi:hypothetical protein
MPPPPRCSNTARTPSRLSTRSSAFPESQFNARTDT